MSRGGGGSRGGGMARGQAPMEDAAYFIPPGVDACYVIRRMTNFPACHEKIMVPMQWRKERGNYTGAMFRRDIQQAVMQYDKLDFLPLQCVRMWYRPPAEAADAYSVLYTSLGRMNLLTETPGADLSQGKAKVQKSSIESAIWALDGTTTVDFVVNGGLRLAIQQKDSEEQKDQQNEDPSYISASEKQRNPNKFLEIPTGILSDAVYHDRNAEIGDHWNMRDIFNDFENFDDVKHQVLIEIETAGRSMRVDRTFLDMMENNTHAFTQEEWEVAIYMIPQKECHKVLDGYWETQDELLSPGEHQRKRVQQEQAMKAKAMAEAQQKEAEKQARLKRGLPPLPEKNEEDDSEDGDNGGRDTPSGKKQRGVAGGEKKEFKRGLRENGHIQYPTYLSKVFDTPLLRAIDKLDRTIAQTNNPYVTDGKSIKKTRSMKNCCLALLNFNRKFTNVNALSDHDGLSAIHKVALKFLLRGRDDAEDSMSEVFTALCRHPFLNLETRDMDGGKTVLEYALNVYWGQLKAHVEVSGLKGGFPEETRIMKEVPRNNIIGPDRKYVRHSVLYELFEPFWQRDSKLKPQKAKPYLKCFRNARNALEFAKRRETFDIDEEMDFRAREARLLKNSKFLDALSVTCSWDPLDLHNARARDQDVRFDGLEMIDFVKNPVFRRIRNKQILVRSFHSLLQRTLVVDIQKSWNILFQDLNNETNVDVHALMTYPDACDGNTTLIHKILRVGTIYDVSIALTGECAVEMNYEPLVAAPTITTEQKQAMEKAEKLLRKQQKLAGINVKALKAADGDKPPFYQSYVDVSQSWTVEFLSNRLQPAIDWSYNVIANRMLSGDRSSVFLGLIVAYVRSPVYRELFSSKVGRRWLISFFVRYRMFADWDSTNTYGQSVLSLAAQSDREFNLLLQSIQQKCVLMMDNRQKQ